MSIENIQSQIEKITISEPSQTENEKTKKEPEVKVLIRYNDVYNILIFRKLHGVSH